MTSARFPVFSQRRGEGRCSKRSDAFSHLIRAVLLFHRKQRSIMSQYCAGNGGGGGDTASSATLVSVLSRNAALSAQPRSILTLRFSYVSYSRTLVENPSFIRPERSLARASHPRARFFLPRRRRAAATRNSLTPLLSTPVRRNDPAITGIVSAAPLSSNAII